MRKKITYFTMTICAVLFLAASAFAREVPMKELTRQVSQKVEKTADNQQVVQFVENLAQKDPAKLANFLLGGKFAYVYNESVIYIGIQGNGEVLVICQINDFEVGTFYYTAHKKGNKVFEQNTAAIPNTKEFVTLFERK